MGNKKISELPTGSTPTGPELVEAVQGGVNVKLTAQQIADLGTGGLTEADLTASRTLTSAGATLQADNLNIIYANSASPFNITVDLLTAGTQITVINIGSGTVTLIEGAGVTLPGTTIPIATDENAIIIYRVPSTPEVYTGTSSGGSGTVTNIATTSPITGGPITTTGTIGINDAVADGATKGAAAFNANDFNSSSGVISLDYTNGQPASGSNKGFLTSSDWTTFNGKQSAITFGTGVQTALGVNVGSAGAPVLFNGAGGTPSSLTLTNATGLPVAGGGSGVSSLTAYAPIFGGTTSTGAVQSGTVGTAGQVLTSNGAGALPTFQAPASSSTNTLTLICAQYTPVDAETHYWGILNVAPTTTAAVRKIYFRASATITAAEIYSISGTAGSNEAWSLYIRVNNTTDYLIATTSVSAQERIWSNTSLNSGSGISISNGDYIEIKGVCPTWATNPNPSSYGGYIKFTQ